MAVARITRVRVTIRNSYCYPDDYFPESIAGHGTISYRNHRVTLDRKATITCLIFTRNLQLIRIVYRGTFRYAPFDIFLIE